VLLEPGFGGPVVWADAFDFVPVFRGMVHLPEVHQLVEDQVVADGVRGVEDAPVEGNGGAHGTGAPARALVADADALDAESVEGGEFLDPGRKFAGGQSPQMPLERGLEIGQRIGDRNGLIGEADGAGDGIVREVDGIAPEQNLGADGPAFVEGRPLGEAGVLAFQPRALAFEETLGFGEGTGSRNGDAVPSCRRRRM
jgi:hypothetical protein